MEKSRINLFVAITAIGLINYVSYYSILSKITYSTKSWANFNQRLISYPDLNPSLTEIRLEDLNDPGSHHPKTNRTLLETPIVPQCKNDSKPYKILLWTDKYMNFNISLVNYQHYSNYTLECPHCRCVLTTNKSEVETSDLLFFSQRNLHNTELPTYRKPEQIWLIYNREAPEAFWPLTPIWRKRSKIPEYRFLFNWSSTLRFDADVPHPLYHVLPNDKPPLQRQLTAGLELRMATKKFPMLWPVSNCYSHSNRELLARRISKYLPIHIYGKCGDYECPKGEAACWRMMEEKYYFYLAFENSICKDYITEKLFRTLQHYVIPVVYAEYDDMWYQRLPPKSFINVKDFATIKQLTDYMTMLMYNEDRYAEYFQWKLSYKIIGHQSVWCKICAKLNEGVKPKILDMENWFFNNTCRDRISIDASIPT